MSNGGSYFSITIAVSGAGTSAYYALTPTSDLTISEGGVTFAPSSLSATMVNIYPQELQIQAPAGSFTAGVSVITSENVISGLVEVSPPVDVATVITVYAGSQQIGQKIIDPAVGSGAFAFPIGGTQTNQLKQILSGKK